MLSSGINEIKAEIDYKCVTIPLMLTELQKWTAFIDWILFCIDLVNIHGLKIWI